MRKYIITTMGLASLFVIGVAIKNTVNHDNDRCSNLDEDFVNNFYALQTSRQLRTINPSYDEAIKTVDDNRQKESDQIITQLTIECGERAAQSAIRKAGQAVGL